MFKVEVVADTCTLCGRSWFTYDFEHLERWRGTQGAGGDAMKPEEPTDEQEPQVEWTLVACGDGPETGRRRCTYTWMDGTRETFVAGIHPPHIKGMGRAVRPEGP